MKYFAGRIYFYSTIIIADIRQRKPGFLMTLLEKKEKGITNYMGKTRNCRLHDSLKRERYTRISSHFVLSLTAANSLSMNDQWVFFYVLATAGRTYIPHSSMHCSVYSYSNCETIAAPIHRFRSVVRWSRSQIQRKLELKIRLYVAVAPAS